MLEQVHATAATFQCNVILTDIQHKTKLLQCAHDPHMFRWTRSWCPHFGLTLLCTVLIRCRPCSCSVTSESARKGREVLQDASPVCWLPSGFSLLGLALIPAARGLVIPRLLRASRVPSGSTIMSMTESWTQKFSNNSNVIYFMSVSTCPESTQHRFTAITYMLKDSCTNEKGKILAK